MALLYSEDTFTKTTVTYDIVNPDVGTVTHQSGGLPKRRSAKASGPESTTINPNTVGTSDENAERHHDKGIMDLAKDKAKEIIEDAKSWKTAINETGQELKKEIKNKISAK